MSIENIQFNKGAVNIGECISKGWEILKPNYLIFFAIGVLLVILGCIPFVSWFLVGPMMVGIQYGLLKQYRGEQAGFGDLFAGFNKLISAVVIGFLFILPGIVLNTYNLSFRIAQLLAIYNPNELTAGMATLVGFVSFAVNSLAAIGSVLFGITFVFAPPILAEKDLSLTDTIKLSARAGWSNFGGLFLLFLVLGLIMFAGLLALCIGFLFVLPLIYAAFAVAYRQVFPIEDNRGDQQFPPSPENYGNMYGQSG
ncbi:MAG: hypothetical protein R2681_00595 [Pyrinomonadaceae bacterium]